MQSSSIRLRRQNRNAAERFIQALSAFQQKLERRFDPDQPRVPAGQTGAGQWTGDNGDDSTEGGSNDFIGMLTLAATRRRGVEAFCEAQLRRDIFQCKMVGLRSCYAQANLRYANCLVGLPIPPLNY
ncbi:MAG: hypothetical protein ACRCUE_14335 [Bosea sp. (in: a-proteobacteria)]